MKTEKPIHAKPSVYAYYFESLKAIAKDYGYNLVVHGSMARDLDLIAIPWISDPKDEFDMINAMSEYMNGFKSDNKGIFLNNILPGGRSCYVLNINRGGYMNTGTGLHEDRKFLEDPQYYIDISVTPNVLKLQSRIEELQKEVDNLKVDIESYQLTIDLETEQRRRLEKEIQELRCNKS